MTSQLKSETARLNGAKSRGPKSAEGREKSSRNALKHGFTADHTMILDCENPDDFHQLLTRFVKIHQPANLAERDLVEEMATARWRVRRMRAVEAGLLNDEIRARSSKTDSAASGGQLSPAFRTLADESHSLTLANRYESRIQRIYDRAYRTLRELQQARKSEEPAEPVRTNVFWIKSPEATPPPPQTKIPNEPTGARTKELIETPKHENTASDPGIPNPKPNSPPDTLD
jgi:hypothetical protein